MGSRQEPWKKFLKVATERLNQYIERYPEDEKKILNEFTTIIKGFDADTVERRQVLSKKFLHFIESYYLTDTYYKFPFLWFAVSYFTYANIELSTELFKTGEFYRYLTKAFRGDKSQGWKGVFDLIKSGTPLTDKSWDIIQKRCIELPKPLSQRDYHRLITIYTSILDPRFNIFSQKQICQRIGLNKNDAISFFKRLDSRWASLFHLPAFGLRRLVCLIELASGHELPDLLNVDNRSNPFLPASEIYQVIGSGNRFYCIFYSPTTDSNLFKMFFDILLDLGYIQSYSLSNVQKTRLTASFKNYTPYYANKGRRLRNKNIGWNLDINIRLNGSVERADPIDSKELTPIYSSPDPDPNWFYQKHKLPDQVIKTFCNFQQFYEFQDLSVKNRTHGIERKRQLKILRELRYKKVLTQFYIPYRLLYSFSLKNYFVEVPKNLEVYLEELLQLLPFCQIFYTKEKIILYTYLTSRIKEHLKSSGCIPVRVKRNLQPDSISFDWFDVEELKWKPPHFSIKKIKKEV